METLRVSSKRQAKIKMALQGCAGSGKTYSVQAVARPTLHFFLPMVLPRTGARSQ